MSKYDSIQEVATEVNEFFDSLGWDDNGRVLAVSVRKCDGCDEYGYILEGYTHELYLVWTTDSEDGVPYSSNIMGQVLPVIPHDDGTIDAPDRDGIDEVFGGGPSLQDVCVGRALQWLGDGPVDIEPGWREWPSTDLWADTYGEDLSSK